MIFPDFKSLFYCAKATQNIQVVVDAIVYGYSNENGVSILLIKRKYEPFQEQWAIPGGFVKDDELSKPLLKGN